MQRGCRKFLDIVKIKVLTKMAEISKLIVKILRSLHYIYHCIRSLAKIGYRAKNRSKRVIVNLISNLNFL